MMISWSPVISGGLLLVVVGGRGPEDVRAQQMAGYPRRCLNGEDVARRNGPVAADPLIDGLRSNAQQARDTGLTGSQLPNGGGDCVHAAILSIALVIGQAMLSYIGELAVGQSSDA